MLGPNRWSAGWPSSARADTGRMMRSATRYQTAVVVMPPNATAVKMYNAADNDSVAPSAANETAPTAQVSADSRTASVGAASVRTRSCSVGVRCSRSHTVLVAKRLRRTRTSTGTTMTANTASAAPPRHNSRAVASGVSSSGAAKDRKPKTKAPPETLTSTAPKIHLRNVSCRSGSVPVSVGPVRGRVTPVDAKAMRHSVARNRAVA